MKKKELIVAEDSIKEHLENIEKKEKRIEELYGELEAVNTKTLLLQ